MTTPRPPKPKPRNKNEIHARPLPILTHPLPAFLPHNPLSLLRLAWALLSELVFPPSSHSTPASKHRLFRQVQDVHTAYLDEYTHTVHVTDSVAVRALWEGGFFGKGSLSRSEPEWVERVRARREDERVRRSGGRTAAEVTGRRRTERREMKRKRAREEVLALERRLKEEREGVLVEGDGVDGKDGDGGDAEAGKRSNGHVREGGEKGEVIEELEEAEMRAQRTMGDEEDHAAIEEDSLEPLKPSTTHVPSESEPFTNQEHLQLSPYETFFLVYGLGILRVLSPTTNDPLAVPALLTHFCATATFPPPDTSTQQGWADQVTTLAAIEPDNPFLLHYAAYHHFRSLGWVARSGVKFAVDILLYARGPVFAHAQFAVMLLPTYKDPYWDFTAERRRRKEKAERKDWWWFHGVNRVQSAVMKTLVLCYVEVPRPMDVDDLGSEPDVGALLRRYRVRCVVCKRWTPQRNLK